MSQALTYSNAIQRPGNLRQVVETSGFVASEEITGGMLHQAFGWDEPYLINTHFAQIFAASQKYHGKPLLGMTEAKGKSMEIPSHAFRFTLSGGTFQKARVTAVVCTDPKPGLHNTEFQVVFDKPWFNISDVIQPADNKYRVRVMHNPLYGNKAYKAVAPNQYEYTLRLITETAYSYLKPEYIEEQAEWNQVSSAVANESNQDGGGFSFYSVFESEGQVQQHAKQISISDRAARMCYNAAQTQDYSEVSAIGDYHKFVWTPLTNGQGEMRLFGMQLMEAKMRDTLYSDVEDTLMFGKKSSNMYSAEGYTIYTASGLREQIESGWVLEHNGNLTLREMEAWFDSIMRDRIDTNKQKIVLSCGREFRKMFDRMVKAESSSFLTLDTHFIRSGEDFRHLDYGSYYAHYRGFTVDISVMENVAYDNQAFCPRMHPLYPNTTVDSWRADIIDFGLASVKDSGSDFNNIMMLSEALMDYRISSNGKWMNPFNTQYVHGMPITDGGLGQLGGISGYSLHIEKSAGLMVADATRCGVIRLADDEVYGVA